MASANRVFVLPTLQLVADFSAIMQERYGSPLERLDFAHDARGSTAAINRWVKDATRGHIDPLLEHRLSSDTALVLVNAVYLKARWELAFDPAATRVEAFALDAKRAVQVPFMHSHGRYEVAHVDGMSMLEIPYAGDRLVMDIVLPDEGHDLLSLEARLDEAGWNALAAALSSLHGLDVKLPRFRLAGATAELQKPLKKLGLAGLFDFASADLTGIGGSKGALAVGEVFHQAFVEVNEEGTEAAAATAVQVALKSAHRPAFFHVDRPFLFAIRDRVSGIVVFLGHVLDPR
jgi:serpin B